MNTEQNLKAIKAAITKNGIDWQLLSDSAFGEIFIKMTCTTQEPIYHGEGNVFEHTKLTVESLINLPEYNRFNDDERLVLILGALLHDIGKIRCTQKQDGVIVSPHHASVGARMAREFMWRELLMCGSEELSSIREAVCLLIKYHTFPPFAAEHKHGTKKVLGIAANAELFPLFSLEKLYLIEKADVLGRISADNDDYLERIELFKMMAEEANCFYTPYRFPSDYSMRAFFKGKSSWQGEELFDDTWGEVILMSGLPGTGKDTWISRCCPDMPVISLDAIRTELKILPTENQGKVIATAHERARELLRVHIPFVWNATSITGDIRLKQISLFESYGASVKTVFLETEWNEEIRRNSSRKAQVDLKVIEKMLSKLEMPERTECQTVKRIIT